MIDSSGQTVVCRSRVPALKVPEIDCKFQKKVLSQAIRMHGSYGSMFSACGSVYSTQLTAIESGTLSSCSMSSAQSVPAQLLCI